MTKNHFHSRAFLAAALVATVSAAPACQARDTPREPAAPAAPALTAAVRASGSNAVAAPPSEPASTCATLRDVVVSDVMRVEGTTLFYVEASGGLTIADVSDAAHPALLAVIPLPGLPRALFVREGIVWVISVGPDPKSGIEDRTWVRAIDARNPRAPRVLAVMGETSNEGSARDAKLVGGFVYVLRGVRGRSAVDVFGIRDGSALRFDSVDLEGVPAQLAASPAGLAAVTVTDADSRLSWVDLSMERAGAVAVRETVRVPGGVATWEHGDGRIVDADEGQRVRLVTCATRSCAPSEGATLRIVDFAALAPSRTISSMKVTAHDGLPVTRFTDGLLYVAETLASGADATMLHVIDTTDATPRFTAHVPLRGRISALVPRDTSLVALGTIGSDATQLQVIMHDLDVRGKKAPRVRGTVAFGSDWTWSAALDQDRAVSFDPASHFAAVPFTAWRHADKRYVTGTQMVDMGPYGTQANAAFEADGLVERAVFLDGHLVTVGPKGISSIDYTSTHNADLRERTLDVGGGGPTRKTR